jgi:Ca2+-binding RTX toxin-like protein
LGSLGTDTLIGGEDDDTYSVDNASDTITEKLDEGTDLVKASASYVLPSNAENLTLTGNLDINGTGNGLANIINGNNAANTLIGGFGGDVLNGGADNDSLVGGAGSDTLNGGAGNDSLTGGLGMDVFGFTSLAAGTDTITDFSHANDTIQLDSAAFTKLTTTGVLDIGMFVKGAAAIDLDDYVIYDPDTGILTYDANGSALGAGVQIALLTGNLALTNTDFMVV